MPDVHDGPLPPTTVAHVRALAQEAATHDGVTPLGEQTLLDLADADAPVLRLVEPGDDRPAGYAQIDVRGDVAVAELVVAPHARRRGAGRRLLDATRHATDDAGRPLRVWAHGDLPAAQALAAAAGMTPQRALWQMSRDLTVVPPPPPLPDDVVVRPFRTGRDEDAWLAVNARAFADHPEQGRMTREDLAARQREPWFDPGDLLLAERDGRVLAFTWLKVEPDGDTGELYVLGVDPAAQGMGLGRLLTALTLERLAGRGLRTAVLYTEADNTAAVRTYNAAGFTRSRVDVQYG